MPDPTHMTHDPLARALLEKLAACYRKDEPLGSFARAVLMGEASPREAALNPWHGEALARAFVAATRAQRELSADARQEIEESAHKLREAVDNDLPMGADAQDGGR